MLFSIIIYAPERNGSNGDLNALVIIIIHPELFLNYFDVIK